MFSKTIFSESSEKFHDGTKQANGLEIAGGQRGEFVRFNEHT